MSKSERLYRDMEIRIAKEGDQEVDYRVQGYASTFEPYVLFRDGDIEYSEVIDPHAFDECDMSDVVLRIDHEGRVYARTRAGDLNVGTDEHGLWQEADLSRTSAGRALYEDIEAGHYDRMSFAFTVAEGGDEYDKKTHLRTIHKIEKLYDVSPVSFPANPGTQLDVATRDYFNGVIEVERAERLIAEERAAKVAELTARIERLKNNGNQNHDE